MGRVGAVVWSRTGGTLIEKTGGVFFEKDSWIDANDADDSDKLFSDDIFSAR